MEFFALFRAYISKFKHETTRKQRGFHLVAMREGLEHLLGICNLGNPLKKDKEYLTGIFKQFVTFFYSLQIFLSTCKTYLR